MAYYLARVHPLVIIKHAAAMITNTFSIRRAAQMLRALTAVS